MVVKPDAGGSERPARVLALREDRTFRLSRRALARLEAFARECELNEEFALHVLIAHGLGTIQRSQPIHVTVLIEPRLEGPADHKQDPNDVL